MNSVSVKVADQIATIAPQVEDKVVGVLVTRELERRSNAMVQVMDKLAGFEKDMNKLRPDQASYDEKGAKINEWFSKPRVEEKAKLQKNIDKHTNALNKALEKGDFSDLFNLASGKPTAEDSGAGTAEAA